MDSNKTMHSNRITNVMKRLSSSIRMLLVALCLLSTLGVHGGILAANSAIRGDLNGDGQLSVIDITILVEHILTGEYMAGYNYHLADLNNDGDLSVVDLTIIVEMILNGTIEEAEVTTPVEDGTTPPGGWGPSQAGQGHLWE